MELADLSRTNKQLSRFLVVGGLTVAIDLLVYTLLLSVSISVDVSKAFGFFTGALFAYFANQKITFESDYSHKRFVIFWLVYLANLVLNVFANKLLLVQLGETQIAIAIAFIFATLVSASMNFLGMKFLVFR